MQDAFQKGGDVYIQRLLFFCKEVRRMYNSRSFKAHLLCMKIMARMSDGTRSGFRMSQHEILTVAATEHSGNCEGKGR